MTESQLRLREIPQVGGLLADPRLADLQRGRKLEWVTRLVQEVVADLRADLTAATGPVQTRHQLVETAVARIRQEHEQLLGPSWTRVINGTGVVVHTNLGRARLPQEAVEAAAQVGLHPSDLEIDLPSGGRGHRGRRTERKLALLAGAEDALVVNNNAAAVWLAVRHLSRGGAVVLSRGEVVAIGGSFRMHEILAETGCRLIEIGTTNRTTLADYGAAIAAGATVLKVHRSNFTVEGFTAEVGLAELAELCRARQARLIYDAGSGALFPCGELGLPGDQDQLARDVASGADLVTCSGDKLLGACQAGIILGNRELIAGLREHPLRRALRVDKTTLAALDAVLCLYLAAEGVPAVPTLEILAQAVDVIAEKAQGLLRALSPLAPQGWQGSVVDGTSSVGGGAFSTATLPTRLLVWSGPKRELEDCHRRLRLQDPALVCRMNQDGLAVDPRTIDEREIGLAVQAFRQAWRVA